MQHPEPCTDITADLFGLGNDELLNTLGGFYVSWLFQGSMLKFTLHLREKRERRNLREDNGIEETEKAKSGGCGQKRTMERLINNTNKMTVDHGR